MPKNHQEAQKTALLLLEILHHIPKRGVISAPEIHKRLAAAGHHLTLRSVQRHLKDLCQQFDIECDDSGKPYGYRWLPQAQSFALPQLTPQESLLLSLAEQQLDKLLPAKVMTNLSGFFEQAKKNLHSYSPAHPPHQLEKEWLAKIRVVSARQPLLPPNIKDGVFETVSDALYANHWLSLKYRNSSGKISEPTVMPLGLAQQGERLYLVCRYEGYDNERSLALHRIQSAKPLTATFKRPRGFNLAQYDNDGRFLFGEGSHVQLSFCIDKISGKHLFETPLSTDQTIETHDNHLFITATVIDSEALTWWLNGFGKNVWNIMKKSIN